MHFPARFYLLCTLLATVATAFVYADSAPALGCLMAVEDSNGFDCSSKKCLCSIPDFFGAVMDCVEKSAEYSPAVREASLSFLARKCKRYTKITASDVENYAEQYELRHQSGLIKREEAYNATYYEPLGVAIMQNHYDSALFGWAMYGFLLLVFILRTITHFSQRSLTSLLAKLDTPFCRKVRKNVLLSPLWKKRHSAQYYFHGFSFNIPTRDISLVIFFLFLFNFIVMFVKYEFKGLFFLPGDRQLQLTRYIADRSGIIATVMMPALYLFGGRNNFLLWITGWPLDTFNVLHKWIGRLIIVNLSVHALGWLLYFIIGAISVPEEWAYTYWYMGNVAFFAGLIIFFQAMHYFRALNYELFLCVHIICALLFTIGAWYHLDILGEMQYVYATCAVWAFDRAVRIARILMSGVTSKAEIKRCPGDVLEVKISYSGRWKFYPGCYIFIHFVRWNRWWQNHPFTLIESPKQCDDGKLVFFCKAKRGVTKHTMEFLDALERGEHTMTVWVEGPYGSQHPIHNYDTAVMVAGGIGISGIYTYALDLMKRATNQRIIFVWVISDSYPLVWFKSYLEAISRDSRFDIRIYIKVRTTECAEEEVAEEGKITPKDSVAEKSVTDTSTDSDYQSSNTTIQYGKPCISQLVSEVMLDEGNGTCGFLVCGPGPMNDEVRNSVRQNLVEAKHRADFYEESFSW
ncbi:ferric/cupric reductase transmembrane component 2 [Trichomonascus vanleenenianus]|uniref:ferric/cupric reductase transmembrane component 2 n=1 Tax=Trichomonascus vanleenenianus TaxID=2268995 RepID=UPI003ECBAA20